MFEIMIYYYELIIIY